MSEVLQDYPNVKGTNNILRNKFQESTMSEEMLLDRSGSGMQKSSDSGPHFRAEVGGHFVRLVLGG